MTGNQDRLRHGRVSHHSSVRMESDRLSRSPVDSSSFDAKVSISTVQVFPTLSSRRYVPYVATLEVRFD